MSFDQQYCLVEYIQHRFDIYCPVKSKCCTVSVKQIAGFYTRFICRIPNFVFLNQLMFWCFLSQVHMSQQRISCISDHCFFTLLFWFG